MRTFIPTALLLLLFTALPAQAGSGWDTDFENAKADAKKRGTLIFAFFTGSDWCGWCVKFKKDTLDTREFMTYAEKSVVLLEVDRPRNKPQSNELKTQNSQLVQKYGVRGYPTVKLLDCEGKEIATYDGNRSFADLRQWIDGHLAANAEALKAASRDPAFHYFEDEAMRLWSPSTGKKVRATLIARCDDQKRALLQTEDGEVHKVKYSNLSDGDVSYIKNR